MTRTEKLRAASGRNRIREFQIMRLRRDEEAAQVSSSYLDRAAMDM